MGRPTLLQEVEQFVYAYAQNLPNRKLLYQIVNKWEEAYLARIEELERQPQSHDLSRMDDEGGSSNRASNYDPGESSDDDDDLSGTRYADDDDYHF